ncbi:MAG: CapA family protein [Bacteroidota bacterium]
MRWAFLAAITLFPTRPVLSIVATSLPDTLGGSGVPEVVVMRFGGDCLLAEHYERAAMENPGLAFDGFELLSTADIGMVNLECPVTTRGIAVEKPFTFRMQPAFLPALKQAGIDIVNIANNHIYDYGAIGLFDTIEHLDSAGIAHVGAGRTHDEAHQPIVIERAAYRIGFLGYYGGGEAPAATADSPGVARRDVELIQRDIRALKEHDSANFIVVNLHWGTEKADTPDTWQTKVGRAIIDAGADAVIGHHPHVLQGIERYKHGVIAYSLGNFIFGGNSRHTYNTGIFEIKLGAEPTYTFIPVRVENWRATVPADSVAAGIRMHVAALSRIFRQSIFTTQENE